MLPANPLDGLLSAFDSSGSRFVIATPDGRARTYDTVTGRLRSTLTDSTTAGGDQEVAGISNGNLAEGYTCLAWVDTLDDQPGAVRSWVALGTNSGAIKMYDSASGELRWQTAGCHEGAVAALAYTHSRSSLLVSGGRDGHALLLDPSTGKKQGTLQTSKYALAAAALSSDGSQLVIGGSTLSVWDVDSQQRLSKFAGHPLPVRALTYAANGAFALSAADGERLLAVWPTPSKSSSSSSSKKKSAVAAASLAVDQPIVGISTVDAGGDQPGSFYAAATTEAGQVSVWLIRPAPGKAVEAAQVARVAVGTSDRGSSKEEVILAAAFEKTPQGVSLLLAAGTPLKPRFQRLQLSSSSTASRLTYVQPSAADSLIRAPSALGQQQQQQANGTYDVEMLGPDNAGEVVHTRVAGSKSSKKRQEPEPDGHGAGAGGEREAAAEAGEDYDGGEDEADGELAAEQTLGDRVAQLEEQQQQQNIQQQGLQQQHQQHQQEHAPDQQAAAAAAVPSGPLKADSLAVLMSQALRSSDKALLERCLAVNNERVVATTVRRLVPLDAALLLRAAVERLQSRPSRGQQLACWIQAVLLHHTAYLMSAPGAAPVMSSLFQIIEARLAMQRQLLSLAGRLDLLLAQPGGQRLGPVQGDAEAAAAAPQVVYQESDSDVEVELVDAAGRADGEADDSDYTDEEDGDEDEEQDDSDDNEDDEDMADDDDDDDDGDGDDE